MHIVDYTKLFKTPDELADFLMLEMEEQNRILAEFAQTGRVGGAEMWCRRPENAQNGVTER
jgi:hypothetical protein